MTTLFVATEDTPTERVCGCCGEKKPVSAFYKDGKDSSGNIKYRRDCKDCYKQTRAAEMYKKIKGATK